MIRLAVRVERAQAELVLAELLELVPEGVEETELGEDRVEYAVYGAPGELPSLPDLRAAAGGALVEVSTSETADDWQERWRVFHRPIVVRAESESVGRPHAATGGERDASERAPRGQDRGPDGANRISGASAGTPLALYVRPPWESPPRPAAGMREIVIDPGRAFGTGAHATTRLCLQLLLDLAAAGRASGPLVDLGTGSGVLAIAAVRLGFAPVLALDNEAESVQAARQNAAANGVKLDVERFDLRRHPFTPPENAVVLANLLLPLLLDLSRSASMRPRELIVSGLLREQADEAAAAFAERRGLSERRRLCEGEWAALLLA